MSKKVTVGLSPAGVNKLLNRLRRDRLMYAKLYQAQMLKGLGADDAQRERAFGEMNVCDRLYGFVLRLITSEERVKP